MLFPTLRRRLRIRLNGWFGPLPRPEKWVFIVGNTNSGTTLLHALLGTHPDVGSMPEEGMYLSTQLVTPQDVNLSRLWALHPEIFAMDASSDRGVNLRVLKRQWGAAMNRPHAPVLLEKSPPNAVRLMWLADRFENPYFVGMLRNGYCVVEGIHRKASQPIDLAARQWVAVNEVMERDFAKLPRTHMVRYEEFAANPAATLRSVAEFVGLDPERFPSVEGSWKIHERNAPVGNMNAGSLARLTPEQRETIRSIAGPMLDRFGYTDSTGG